MKNDENTKTEASLKEIGGAANQVMIEAVICSLASRYGVKSAAYLGAGISGMPASEPFLAVTYSADWVEHYKEHR